MPRRSLSHKAEAVSESQTLALSARAGAMKREGIDIVSLTAGEPDFPTPAHIKKAGIEAIEKNFTKYTANKGIAELLEAIAAKFKNENNIHWSPKEILVSSGAKHSIFNALQALCNPDDEVIIIAPYWVSYPEMVKLVDARPVILETDVGNEFKISPARLESAITDKTKLLIFNSPSNPTGAVYTENEVAAIAEVIAKTGIYVISDEIYEHLTYEGNRHISIGAYPEVKDLTVTVNGVSKAFSMTGWRLGYMGGAAEIISLASKYQGQVTSNASSIAQKAALCALTSSLDDVYAMRDAFQQRRDFIVDGLNSIPEVQCAKPLGAFYVFPKLDAYFGKKYGSYTIGNDIDLCEFLLVEGKVATVPGSAFGAPDYLRLSYASAMEDLEKGIHRLGEALALLQS
jgi:aspartate aminotransferase